MQLFNTKTVAALFITGMIAVGTASAGDLDSKKPGNADDLTNTVNSDAFIDVKGAVASRFKGFFSTGNKGLSARQLAQQDLLNKSARFASNNFK